MSRTRKAVERLVPLNRAEINFLVNLVSACRSTVINTVPSTLPLVDRVHEKLNRVRWWRLQ